MVASAHAGTHPASHKLCTYPTYDTMKLVRRGAEADILRTQWYGQDAIAKVRVAKPYRHKELDLRIRHLRTHHEAQMLHRVKMLGVNAPLVYFVNLKQYTIIMERIDGIPLHSLSDSSLPIHCAQAGRIAGLLHSAGIMHGDLTTSNLLLCDDRLYLIDMGLSRWSTKDEDWAVDLRLVKEILSSAHAPVSDEAWKEFLNGYSQTMIQWRRVKKLVGVIESRGRYARVT